MNMYNGNQNMANMRRNGGAPCNNRNNIVENNVGAPCSCNDMAGSNIADNNANMPCHKGNNLVSNNANASYTYANKNSVIKAVYELGFVMTEVLLYLDTHPNDSEAIEYYAEMRQRYNEAVEAYENMIGPLSFNRTGADNYFDWAATPLPWEKEGC
jgi:spore coat protein JB